MADMTTQTVRPIEEIAREHAPLALEVLREVMDNPISEDRDRIRAAEAMLDRGYGKPSQAIIQVPASRQQSALLAGMTDDQLVAIIEQKRLPTLAPHQSLVTVEPVAKATAPSRAVASATMRALSSTSLGSVVGPANASSSVSSHGPATDSFCDGQEQSDEDATPAPARRRGFIDPSIDPLLE